MHSVVSHTAQSIRLTASPVIKSFSASSCAWVSSGRVSVYTEPLTVCCVRFLSTCYCFKHGLKLSHVHVCQIHK